MRKTLLALVAATLVSTSPAHAGMSDLEKALAAIVGGLVIKEVVEKVGNGKITVTPTNTYRPTTTVRVPRSRPFTTSTPRNDRCQWRFYTRDVSEWYRDYDCDSTHNERVTTQKRCLQDVWSERHGRLVRNHNHQCMNRNGFYLVQK